MTVELTEAAKFAAYCAQIDNLALRPWQSPPCFAERPNCDAYAVDLLQRLLAAGLSRWEPDPAGALARIEASPPAA